ncbi:MAG: hypothetical protein LBT95_01375 [Treponema sp.]|jgi:hypothetical protein|nr:hypothetical protein [Treponema sp.]
MIVMRSEDTLDPSEIEILRYKINDEAYLHEAIQRIALILSNELFEPQQQGGEHHEWKK